MKAEHYMSKCSQCMSCVRLCSGAALDVVEGVFTYTPGKCTFCEVCMDVCDNGAIKVME